ncbi:MAG TPA: hypothetical protein DCQ06_07740, partial [Myxococcales bacterium]|nr:hypothetical protein [Myxococcales bacterium]
PLEPSLKFNLKKPIDDLRLYVGCSTDDIKLGKAFISAYYPGTELGTQLKERFKGDDYQPWAMSMAFHCDKPWFFDQSPETVDDLPKDRNDFLSTARHEIGHCLGLLNAAIAKSQVQTIEDAPYFTGKHAVEVFGGPVPLEADARHIKNGLMSGGTEARMDPSTKKGTRKWPTPVDIAILKDIGYEIVSLKP